MNVRIAARPVWVPAAEVNCPLLRVERGVAFGVTVVESLRVQRQRQPNLVLVVHGHSPSCSVQARAALPHPWRPDHDIRFCLPIATVGEND